MVEYGPDRRQEEDHESDGPNAHIDLIPLWRFTLGKRDALLVLKALGNRLTEEEDEAAMALCDRLTLQRATVGKEMVRHLERAAEHATKKGDSHGG